MQAVLLAFGLPVILLVLVPICALIKSINPGTLLQYLGDPSILQALRISLVSSLVSTGLIVLFGTPFAILMARGPCGKPQRLLSGFLNLAIFTPPAVAGLGLFLLFIPNGPEEVWRGSPGRIYGTMAAVILAQCFVACPYFIKSAAASLSALPSALKEAAYLEGASRLQVFLHVTLPLIRRGFLAGAVMSWARGLGEFGATLIFAGNLPGSSQTLPLAIFSNLAVNEGRASVVAVILLLLSFVLLLVIHSLSPRTQLGMQKL